MFSKVLLAASLALTPLAVGFNPVWAADDEKMMAAAPPLSAVKDDSKSADLPRSESQSRSEHQKSDVDGAVTKEERKAVEKADKEQAKQQKIQAKTGQVEATKGQVQHAKIKQKQADKAMVDAANEIDGVKVDPKMFDEKKKFTLGSLNPIKWIFKPIIDMQKQVVHLEKQIMRLEAPIAALQKPMVGLRTDMTAVQEEMQVMHTDINDIHGGMKGVDKRLAHIEDQLGLMYEPVVDLKNPVIALERPVNGVSKQLNTLKADLKELKDVVSLTTKLILAAVIGVGLLIVVGTPVAALFAWRHRRTIMEKLGSDTKGKAEPTEESPAEKREALAKDK